MSAQITITTSILPPIVVPLTGGAGGDQPSFVMAWLKPRLQVYGPDGAAFVDEAPAGNPPQTWPIYTFGGLMVVALVLVLAVRGAMK